MSKALEVLQELKECASYWGEYDVPIGIQERIDEAITELLTKPEQEPVATKLETPQFQSFRVSFEDAKKLEELPVGTKIYTSPPKREPLSCHVINILKEHGIGEN